MKTERWPRGRKNFGRGAWNAEPDKAHWVDEATGLDCLIVRNHLGALCGYVGVPEEHRFYGKHYDQMLAVDVHGGLTYADECNGHICHDADNRVWWLGFDCAHLHDLVPGMKKSCHSWRMRKAMRKAGYADYPRNEMLLGRRDKYRTFKYVKAECAALAAQLV